MCRKTKRQTKMQKPYPQVETYAFGRLVESVDTACVTNCFEYDALDRRVAAIDGRNNRTVYAYDEKNNLVSTTDAVGAVTAYGYDVMGQTVAVTNALGNVITYEYDLQGNKTYEGGATYPVRYAYDTFGNKISMTTYRNEASGVGDTTTWAYDEASGVLLSKTYADGKGLAYTYTNDGKLATRTNARGIGTTYAYDTWGQLLSIDYADFTPDITYTYDAMGRPTSATDAVGTTIFAYDAFGQLTSEQVSGLYTKTLTRHYDTYGRNVGYSMDGDRKQSIVYSSATGRIAESDGFKWSYLPGTHLKSSLTYPNDAVVTWSYDPHRDLLTAVTNATYSTYTYTNDLLGRRVEMRTQSAASDLLQRFVYDNYLCVQQLRTPSNTICQSYVWDPTEPIATRPLVFQPTSGEIAYYFHDGNKNVSDLVDIQGNIVHYAYTPFGAPTASALSENPFRFSSELYDNPLALTYYNYRHYNSSDGRWNRKDSLGEKISQNQYSFIINSPISLYDWLGCIGISTTVGGPLSFSPEPSSGKNSLILCYSIRAALFGLAEFDTSGRTLLPVNEVGRQIYNTWISGGGDLELSPDDFDANNVARDAAQSVIAQEAAHWNPDLKCGETSTMTANNRRLKGGATSTVYAIRGYDFSYSFTLSRHKECDENDCCLKITTNTSYTFTFYDEFVFRDKGTFAGIIPESYVRDCAAHYNWGVGMVRSRATATNTQTNEESCN